MVGAIKEDGVVGFKVYFMMSLLVLNYFLPPVS